jgi:hypothetical protein
MAFSTSLSLLADGEKIEAAVANRPLLELLENTQYLKNLLDTLVPSTGVFAPSQVFKNDVLVGQPVYWNDANSRFEKAIATAGNDQVVGVRYSAPSTTLGDLLLCGYAELDLTNALNGETLVAGRYYLSPDDAGVIVDTAPPDGTKVNVLYADGAGKVFVLPQIRDYQGPAGPTGATGATGATGPAAGSIASSTGTTGDALAQAFTQTTATGVSGSGTVKNTGSNSMTIREAFTDAFAVTSYVDTTIAAGSDYRLDASINLGTGRPPYTTYTLSVRSTTPGQSTTYTAKFHYQA